MKYLGVTEIHFEATLPIQPAIAQIRINIYIENVEMKCGAQLDEVIIKMI